MCGIFGYIGEEDPVSTCLFGLKQLEYRGYDSSGIAGISASNPKELLFCKKVGKIAALEKHVSPLCRKLSLAIAHTRWATHGKLTDENAHPHFDVKSQIALVHNGIIENYATLKSELEESGIQFTSETDTEVIVQLIGRFYQGDLLLAVQKTLDLLKGSFAIALIHHSHPNQIIAAARENSLCIGLDVGKESIISSDPNAMLSSIKQVLFLKDGEIAQIERGKVLLFDFALEPIARAPENLHAEFTALSRQGFDHYMLKEIFEQPATIQKALLGRMNREEGTVEFKELRLREKELLEIRSVFFIGCGTSAHAGQLATLLFEDLAHLPAQCDIASEARYRNLTLTPDTLVIAISQSGETADTLAAMREAKRYGCKTLGICNVVHSTLAREADSTLFLCAGPEISVCSTKAFTSQLAVLVLLALHLARLRGVLDKEALLSFFAELQKIPGQIQQILDQATSLQTLAKKYAEYDDFFFIGRSYMVPTCQEAALKLKEISYVNANGVPAGELKHGLIALVHERFPVVAFCGNEKTQEKIASNIMQVKARGAPVLAFLPDSCLSIAKTADDVFLLASTLDPLSPFLSTIAGQLLAYYIAKERGCDIDQPRNLAKSVTVE